MKKVFFHFIQDFRAYKIRFLLVLFGVAWGTTTIILLMGFGVGMMTGVQEGMSGMGEHIAILWAGQTSIPYKGLGIGRHIRFVPEDAELLREKIDIIEETSPEFITWGKPIRYKEMLRQAKISGVNPTYGKMRKLEPENGRFINKLDIEQRRRVIFLGNEEKAKVFGEQKAVGEKVLLNGVPFTVIGVLKEKAQSSSYSGSDEQAAFIPYTTFKVMYGRRYLNNMVYRPISPELAEEAQQKVYEVLSKKYKFDPNDKEALSFWDVTEMEEMMGKMTKAIEIFLALVGAMTLLIAGAAVANIMYFLIDERTKEIGIKRSVGATAEDILKQFFFESLILSSIGGVIGICFSSFILYLCSFIPRTGMLEFFGTPKLSPEIPIITFIILFIIAFFAGYFPAKKAASLNPVECLRYE
jgi:putative ABC transport system permease protein